MKRGRNRRREWNNDDENTNNNVEDNHVEYKSLNR